MFRPVETSRRSHGCRRFRVRAGSRPRIGTPSGTFFDARRGMGQHRSLHAGSFFALARDAVEMADGFQVVWPGGARGSRPMNCIGLWQRGHKTG
jgi:hypothetical protein